MNKIYDNLVTDLKRGTLVLTVLLTTKDPIYGYSLVQLLNEKGIDIDKNTLYPLLRRLETQGLLESVWDTTESRPRKYYKRSKEGTRILNKLKDEWLNINTNIHHIMEG